MEFKDTCYGGSIQTEAAKHITASQAHADLLGHLVRGFKDLETIEETVNGLLATDAHWIRAVQTVPG
jgi:hypothetical protein